MQKENNRNQKDQANDVLIREILYFDREKAISLLSQIEWGLTRDFTVEQDKTKTHKNIFNLNLLKFFSGTHSRERSDRERVSETKEFHHDLLNRVEILLKSNNAIIEMFDNSMYYDLTDENAIRSLLGDRQYINASGSCFIEDYSRILSISSIFNQQVNFINRCNIENDATNENNLRLAEDLRRIEKDMRRAKNANERATKENEMNQKYDEIGKMTKNHVEQWLFDGISLWINTYLKDRLIFRILPSPNCPSFQIICNMKRTCIVDSNIEYLISSYGTKPNIPFFVLGLITSKPEKIENGVNPLDEFDMKGELNNIETVEKGFRSLFPAIEGLESFTRFSRYPNITVEPIAVYRLIFSVKKN